MDRLDIINGVFEFFSGMMVWLNVKDLLRDKTIKGINPYTTIVFTLWGLFNLGYYPHLHQWFSFFGGLVIVVGNTTWIYFMFKYTKRNK